MNLRKRLLVNGKPLSLDKARLELGLNRHGEGTFEVLEKLPASARTPLAEYYLGVGDQPDYLVMTGAVTEYQPLGQARYRIVVRELSSVLDMPVQVNLTQVSARQVLNRIEKQTGLRFLLPAKASYLDERRVRFQSFGSGADALKLLQHVWELTSVVWYQLPDGRMYWGHWSQGPYNASEVPIDPKLILARNDQGNTLDLPCIPALRPGMVVRTEFRFRIDALVFSEDLVRLHYSKF